MRRTGAIALAAALLLLAMQSPAGAETRSYRRHAPTNTEAVIGIGVPVVILDQPPANGFVCVRKGTVRPQSMLIGGSRQYLNTPMQGAQIVYRSRAGFGGTDTVGYTLKFPRVEGTYRVQIDVQNPGGQRATPDTGFQRQQSGPIPECAALVS